MQDRGDDFIGEHRKFEPSANMQELYCRKCDSNDVRPSSHKAVERFLLPKLGIRPYRCRACWHRFYASTRYFPNQDSLATLPLMVEEDKATPSSVPLKEGVPLEEDKDLTSILSFIREGDEGAVPADSSTVAAAPVKRRVRLKFSGFSAGLAAAFVTSAVAAVVFLLFYVHQHRASDHSLISPELRVQRQTALPAQQVVTAQEAQIHEPTAAVQPESGRSESAAHLSPPRAPHSRQSAPRLHVNKRGTKASVLQPAVVQSIPIVTGPTAERVNIATAPENFDYPVAPDPSLRGKISLKLLIGTRGSVIGVTVRSGNPVLAQAAVRAIQHWHYRAPELNGYPVEAEANVTISFIGKDAVTINFRQ